MSDTPAKFSVKDAADLDQRIPRNLMIYMEGKPFILKAGLEWKANQLFGLGKWSLETDIVTNDQEKGYCVAKCRVIFKKQLWENYGEASKENVNPKMHKYLLHMALTRAETRALRVATACGFTSMEELGETQYVPGVSQDEDSRMRVIGQKRVDNEPFLGDPGKPTIEEAGEILNTTGCSCGTSNKYHARACPLFEGQTDKGV